MQKKYSRAHLVPLHGEPVPDDPGGERQRELVQVVRIRILDDHLHVAEEPCFETGGVLPLVAVQLHLLVGFQG